MIWIGLIIGLVLGGDDGKHYKDETTEETKCEK